MNKCNKCDQDKELKEFALRKNKSGLYSIRTVCRVCVNTDQKERRKTEAGSSRNSRLLKQKLWRESNIEKVASLKVECRLKAKTIKLNSMIHDAHVISYFRLIKMVSSLMYDNHISEWKRNEKIHARWKQKHDMTYVLYNRLKRGVQRIFPKANGVAKGWFSLLGYTTKELMSHIESQFTHGMNWDNRHKWHVDHIRPLCSFDIKTINDKEFRECFSLDNLRPVWARHNMMKYHCFDKYIAINRRVPVQVSPQGK